MSCDACQTKTLEKFPPSDTAAHDTYYYRWKNATVAVIACHEHAKEIMDALNRYQKIEEALIEFNRETGEE